ncbi:ABC transporter substrate-binding protein [uncultured Ferrovibrio sp.]|jgi:branched-chain amino acid transport system substrate-binding protein|uniref:ABC transporter substrate-binding protein n=1 Tax=uncultured Ferrovibrio sp. TaxID=1576913 RepID=UPI002630394F|nr:ABC transporter substrate-binding protein [uncultured Ferrovibrio sp.]
MNARQWVASVVMGASLAGAAFAASAQEQMIPSMVYRTGPYAPSGIPVADGYQDFITLINQREGGINGVKLRVEECETQYNTERGVECYERLKALGGTIFSPYSTGITYALIDRAPADKAVIFSMAYGRASATVGNIFPWVFTAPITYWGGASAGIQYFASQLGGKDKLKGKKIAYVYIDIAYGKEPIPVFQNYAQELGFQLELVPVPAPGLEQKSIWLQIRQMRPDFVYLQGWGAMNAVSLKEAAAVGFPREKMLGVWYSSQDSDTQAAGAAAKGYKGLTFHGASRDLPILKQLKEVVLDKGLASNGAKHFGEIGYLRGALNALFVVEALRTAQEKFGKGKVMDGEQSRWGFENINFTEEKINKMGLQGFIAPMKLSCDNHLGDGKALVVQWQGDQWKPVSDWIEPEHPKLWPLYLRDAEAYAREKNIASRVCAKS